MAPSRSSYTRARTKSSSGDSDVPRASEDSVSSFEGEQRMITGAGGTLDDPTGMSQAPGKLGPLAGATTVHKTVIGLLDAPLDRSPTYYAATMCHTALPTASILFISPLLLETLKPAPGKQTPSSWPVRPHAVVPVLYLTCAAVVGVLGPVLGGASTRWRPLSIGLLLLITNAATLALIATLGWGAGAHETWVSISALSVLGVSAAQLCRTLLLCDVPSIKDDLRSSVATAGHACVFAAGTAVVIGAADFGADTSLKLSAEGRAMVACIVALLISGPASLFTFCKLMALASSGERRPWLSLSSRVGMASGVAQHVPQAERFVVARAFYQACIRALPVMGATYLVHLLHTRSAQTSSIMFAGAVGALVGSMLSHTSSSVWWGPAPLLTPVGVLAGSVLVVPALYAAAHVRGDAGLHAVAGLWGGIGAFLASHDMHRASELAEMVDKDTEVRLWQLFAITDSAFDWAPMLYFVVVAQAIDPLPAWSLPGVGSILLLSIVILALGFCGTDRRRSADQVIGHAVFTTMPSRLSVIPESPALSSTHAEDTPRTLGN